MNNSPEYAERTHQEPAKAIAEEKTPAEAMTKG